MYIAITVDSNNIIYYDNILNLLSKVDGIKTEGVTIGNAGWKIMVESDLAFFCVCDLFTS